MKKLPVVHACAWPHTASAAPEKDGTPAAVAGPPEVVKGQGRLHNILRLYEHKLVRHQLLQAGRQAGKQDGAAEGTEAAGEE
jgi:hypothetical protein